jgi:hypothetical protein
MKGKCALFEYDCELQKSHILPKFIATYFSLTGSKYLRAFANPNRRLQDLDKMYLLSKEAEEKFSLYEKWFAENIFKPYQLNREMNFEYNDKLYYFSISVLWRVLKRELHFHDYTKQLFFEKMLKTEIEWRNFLKDYSFPRNYFKINIFLTDNVMYHDLNLTGVDYYFSRSIDSTIVSNKDASYCFVYAKFLKFIIFAFIDGYKEDELKSTLINPIKGQITVPQPIYDEEFLRYYIYRIQEINNLPPASENQQKIINEQFYKEYEELKNKEAWKIILNDWINLDPDHN